ncbi:MAG: tetratricopeptide repeat protein [Prolixibacteraceae bacterium]|nr:tetratricopeptide repeat protein [Prolixibacteraceae bacterium]
MRKIILLFAIFSFLGVSAFAQKGKVVSARSLKDAGKLEKALETINIAIDKNNEKSKKSIDWPTTWQVRGDIYHAIYSSKDANIKKLVENPLQIAYDSYKKAMELDEKNKLKNTMKISLTMLNTDFINQAVVYFNKEKYNEALSCFKNILEIGQLPIMQEKDKPASIDTTIIFNAGLAAYNAENYDEAIKYYGDAAKYGYNKGKTYELIAQCYLNKKDTLKTIDVLQKGFEKYPESSPILVTMINLYITTNKVDNAIKYLDIAIKQDPKNATFYFARGSLYDKIKKTDLAIEAYSKAIELNPKYFDANYNLGAIYYNKGVAQVDVANAIPTNDPKKYDIEKDKADEQFRKSIPFMEKASEINPKDTYSLESLKTLYYRLKMMEKFDEVNKKIEDLK